MTSKSVGVAHQRPAAPSASARASKEPRSAPAEALWAALPTPCLAVDENDRFVAANPRAELFLTQSAHTLRRMSLDQMFGPGSRVADAVRQVRRGALSLSEYGAPVSFCGGEPVVVDFQAAPVFDEPGLVLLSFQPRSVALAMDRSLANQGSTRSLTGLSAMLAHEIKNPLSGISGAAQLLEMTLGEGEAELLQLIQEEVDRIRALVERMDAFGDARPGEREAVNIHDVLDQAKRSARAGFARHVRIREEYDPSLPPVPADRGQLLQAISNLVKNAAEAAPRQGGEIVLKTAFRPGVQIALAGGARERLPLEVIVADNGPGVPEDLIDHIFEPFVTSKAAGSGLGLPLVAKIVGDHGGVVEYRRQNEQTEFRILLPVWTAFTDAAANKSAKKQPTERGSKE
ncbi:MAG: ATP-binding protein [Neomegalonema sp.]|nr:ATP-binding protein [Neomegalonema sp.]